MSYYYYMPSQSDLQHYGVLGMHWGIRRYQPYSTTGPRKGGKTGKEVGEAANSKLGQKKSKSGLSEGQKKALKYAAIGLGVAAAAGVGYIAWQKYGRQYVDLTLKSGKMIQTLSERQNRIEAGEYFYGAVKDFDKNLYKSAFSSSGGELKYNITTKVAQKLKIASPNNSRKVFESLFNKGTSFKESVQLIAKENAPYATKYREGWKDLLDGKPSQKAYDAFNMMLVGKGEAYDKPRNAFFEALKDAGYSGIIDVNDRSYSGFGAKAPVIVFDKTKLIAESVKKLTMDEIDRANDIGYNMAVKEATINQLIQMGTLSSATSSSALGAAWLASILSDQDKKSA